MVKGKIRIHTICGKHYENCTVLLNVSGWGEGLLLNKSIFRTVL